jgi:hypothetical protein
MVGVRGFEPPAPASRRQCSTRLSYTPTKRAMITDAAGTHKIQWGDFVREFENLFG